MKRVEISLVILGLLAVSLFAAGCQRQRERWMEGDLPLGYQKTFGNTNTDQLNFVQAQTLGKHEVLLYGVTLSDPNKGINYHKGGVIERLILLEERVKKLEESQPEVVPEIPKVLNTSKVTHFDVDGAEK